MLTKFYKLFFGNYFKKVLFVLLGLVSSIASSALYDIFKDKIIPTTIIPQGIWEGSFVEHNREILSALRIVKKQDSNKLDGLMIENRGTLQKTIKMKSKIAGSFSGNHIKFTKMYSDPNGNHQKMAFEGTFDSNGKTIEGTWSNNYDSGRFGFRKTE